jgi:hypothetical protein
MNKHESTNIADFLEPYLEEIEAYFDLLDNLDDEVALAIKQIFEDTNELHSRLVLELKLSKPNSDEELTLIYMRLTIEIAAYMFLSRETLASTLIFMQNEGYFAAFARDLQEEYTVRIKKYTQGIQNLRNLST